LTPREATATFRAAVATTDYSYLEFERPLVDLERSIAELRRASGEAADPRTGAELAERLADRERALSDLTDAIFSRLTIWQRVQLSRHPKRPFALDYIERIFGDFVELHGDRHFGDDAAIVGGLCQLDGAPLVVVGTQKGRGTKDNMLRNFGMPRPEGYRKARRLFEMAERFHLPVVTLIDTPGAYPGLDAEERGQAEAIAVNLEVMARLRAPMVAVIIGEGGSGGALALAVANRVLMLEYAVYSVISPEGCASILWKDGAKAETAAEALRITAPELHDLGIVEEIVPEAKGAAHRDVELTANNLRETLRRHLRELRAQTPDQWVKGRYERFRKLGPVSERGSSAP
jgi:acetyl-CoA carboxylase carboxyl transferase subunit alpha